MRTPAGRMTAVMRAAHVPEAPRVLRLGIVRGGRVIDDRIIKSRNTVTVGRDERATVIVDAVRADVAHALFERVGEGYRLHVLPGMSGRVALATGVVDIHAGYLDLDASSRGKIVVGDTTILFQLVVPPPAPTRPQLPLGAKSGLANLIDWNLTIIAAFSFLVHFGVIGGMLSDWMDPVVNDEISVAGLVDMNRRVGPPAIEPPATATEPVSTASPAPSTASPEPAAPAPLRHRVLTPSRDASNATEREAARLEREAEQLRVDLLVSLTTGPAVQNALTRGVPPVDLTTIAKSPEGVSPPGVERQASGGAIVRPGATAPSLVDIGNERATSTSNAGTETAQRGPRGTTVIERTTTSAPIANADAVVAGLKAQLRRCYDKGLLDDATMQGSVTIVTKVAPNGEVAATDPRGRVGLDDRVVSCIQRVVHGAQFAAPGAGGATVNIPVKFVQQGR